MTKLKDIPQIDRPRERFLEKGPDALSKSELLAILLGSGIKGKNVKQLSEQIIRKFSNKFLDITVDDLLEIPGIGKAKALQIVSALALIKRFYEELGPKDNIVLSAQDAVSLTSEIRDKKKEYLVCLYLNARNALLKKEVISIGTLDKSLLHPREIFGPAVELRAAGVVLLHNHPSGDVEPSKQDIEVINKILEAGKIMGVNVIDFIIVSEKDIHSVFQSSQKEITHYVSDGVQHSLFDLLETEQQTYTPTIKKIHKVYFYPESRAKAGRFQLQNRRYLGNKYKLLGFIEDIVNEKCNGFSIFCDIFAGTGVVAERFNEKNIKVIVNDFLSSNFIPLKAFLGTSKIDLEEIEHKINLLNELKATDDNYFSKNFGNTYFTLENARKIGAIREKINELSNNEDEKAVLIASLLYAVDKVANTVGHYDAFRKKLDTVQPLRLLVPDFEPENNVSNEIYKEDANQLIRKINCDVLYIDPPYNSRQYSDAYHLLENLATWEKPIVHGIAKKMDRSHIKSDYCLQSATKAFSDLITNANCKHILLSYNNTGESKDGRSNARINDEQIINILKSRGDVDIFERDYKAFTTGKSDTDGHSERVFYCKVTK
ncbi:MAG: DNA repair protein RadC [Candidatus Pacebacteria bacterium]|jgi:adenine-specific DNA-methyltransferase|nr:DNA repair protein RadC [Candidatus Paceibacterota bacterium]